MSDVHSGKPMVLSGHCLCGGVRFRTAGLVRASGHCHCESCRRTTGSAFASFFGLRDGKFTEVREYSCSYLAQSCFGAVTPDDPAASRMAEA